MFNKNTDLLKTGPAWDVIQATACEENQQEEHK